MMCYWVNYAATGNPNGEDLPLWEPFDERRLCMELTVDGSRMADLANEYVLHKEAEIKSRLL